MKGLRIGLALTGSYCTYDKAFAALEALAQKYDVTALMSENAYATDTRFGDAAGFVKRLEELTVEAGRPDTVTPERLAALNGVIHPAVRRVVAERMAEADAADELAGFAVVARTLHAELEVRNRMVEVVALEFFHRLGVELDYREHVFVVGLDNLALVAGRERCDVVGAAGVAVAFGDHFLDELL